MLHVPGLRALATPSDADVDRWIRRLRLLVAVAVVAFAAFYTFDRWRPASPSIVDRELTTLEQAVRDDPENVAARGRLADVYVAADWFAEAIAQYDAVLATGKADVPAYFGRARARMAAGDLDGAAADYQAVVDRSKDGEMANVDPTLAAAYYGLGEIALQQARPADAIEHLTLALRIKRSDADALYLLGLAQVEAGRPDDAIEPLTRAVAFVPVGWPEPYAALSRAHAAAGRPELAEWAGAMAAFSAGDSATAASSLGALVDGPAALPATVGLGLLAESTGDMPAAAGWYERALAIDADDVSARLGLARVREVGSAGVAPGASALPEPPVPAPAGGGVP